MTQEQVGSTSWQLIGAEHLLPKSTAHATVPHRIVSFMVAKDGGVDQEMVVPPVTSFQDVGSRPIAGDARIDETGSLGEASRTEPAVPAQARESCRAPQPG